MTKKLREGKRAYDNCIQQYPFTVFFSNFANKRNLLLQAVKGNKHEDPLWGLDAAVFIPNATPAKPIFTFAEWYK